MAPGTVPSAPIAEADGTTPRPTADTTLNHNEGIRGILIR